MVSLLVNTANSIIFRANLGLGPKVINRSQQIINRLSTKSVDNLFKSLF